MEHLLFEIRNICVNTGYHDLHEIYVRLVSIVLNVHIA